MMKTNTKKYQKGISAVEVIVVIGILLILSAASYPFLSRVVPYYRLSGASRELISALREAQNLAVTQQYIHIIRFNDTNNNYSIIRQVNGTEEVQQTINLPKKVTISAINLTNNQVSFTSSGAPQNSGTVQLTNDLGKNVTIEITVSGQIKSY